MSKNKRQKSKGKSKRKKSYASDLLKQRLIDVVNYRSRGFVAFLLLPVVLYLLWDDVCLLQLNDEALNETPPASLGMIVFLGLLWGCIFLQHRHDYVACNHVGMVKHYLFRKNVYTEWKHICAVEEYRGGNSRMMVLYLSSAVIRIRSATLGMAKYNEFFRMVENYLRAENPRVLEKNAEGKLCIAETKFVGKDNYLRRVYLIILLISSFLYMVLSVECDKVLRRENIAQALFWGIETKMDRDKAQKYFKGVDISELKKWEERMLELLENNSAFHDTEAVKLKMKRYMSAQDTYYMMCLKLGSSELADMFPDSASDWASETLRRNESYFPSIYQLMCRAHLEPPRLSSHGGTRAVPPYMVPSGAGHAVRFRGL